MTLKQAVKKLGGPSGAASASGIPRTSIIYWLTKKPPPKWRAADIGKIVTLAEQKS